MHRILFVDDEPKILTGLRRMLRNMRNEWEMEFAEGGFQALDLLKASPFDVVVSDARMPGMEGPELLDRIRMEYPATARLILSGQCSRDAVLRCVGVTHQFLSKPCEAETLKNSVRQVCRLRDLLGNRATDAAISRVESLPSLPSAHATLMEKLATESTSLRSVAETISSDIAMTVKVLQLVSSGFFGTPQGAIEVERATELLGLDTLRALATKTNAFRPAGADEIAEEHLRDLTSLSTAVALAARRIAESCGCDRKIIARAQVAGMLHEVGSLVPCPCEESPFGTADEGKVAAPNTMSCRFRAGGYLAALWGLPGEIAEIISSHRCPASDEDEGFTALTAVHVAAACTDRFSEREATEVEDLDVAYLERIGCGDHLGQWQEICHASLLGEVLQ